MPDLFLALDLSTTGCKGGLFNAAGELLAEVRESYSLQVPYPGWVEQDPHGYWQAAQSVCRQLLIDQDPTTIQAVGLSGQTPSLVLVDSKHQPLGAAMIWQDTRATEEAAWLAEHIGAERLTQWLGVALPLTPTWPPARLRWLAVHDRQRLARTAYLLQPKDFVGLQLTGEPFSDPWSSKGLIHLATGEPPPDYYEALGLPLIPAPRIGAPWEVVATVSPAGAAATRLDPGTPVVAGWGDANCGTLATGVLALPETAYNLTGTSEIIGISTAIENHDPRLIFIPSWINGGLGVLYGPTQAGGQSLEWLGRVLTGERQLDEFFREELPRVQEVPPGSQGLLFLPYLRGERAPWWDEAARGAFLGLTADHTRSHLIRAVLEGIAYSARHVLATIEETLSLSVKEVRVAGKATYNPFWNRIRASVLGRPIARIEVTEASLLGAAMLAAIGSGHFPHLVAASEAMVRVGEWIPPHPPASLVYDSGFAQFLQAYPALRPILREGTLKSTSF